MPRLTISSVGMPTRFTLRPSISSVISPRVGRTTPMKHRISVLLPLPLVPSSTTVSPSAMSSETPCSARTAP